MFNARCMLCGFHVISDDPFILQALVEAHSEDAHPVSERSENAQHSIDHHSIGRMANAHWN